VLDGPIHKVTFPYIRPLPPTPNFPFMIYPAKARICAKCAEVILIENGSIKGMWKEKQSGGGLFPREAASVPLHNLLGQCRHSTHKRSSQTDRFNLHTRPLLSHVCLSVSTHHIRGFAQESAFVLRAFTLSLDSLTTQQRYRQPYRKKRGTSLSLRN